ncbi:mediator complex subunit 13 C-terminal-domain-containing protein [Dichomitus squalens]|uniref:Mediator of RNA polymerase II transcription subunit 13 n=1 Tax=Dichomitus squalens TaxID=114155 RepID=A0A4Q9MNF7_9APHY|nr:mediator complex subunit 13 C-terminal-domain-containing protein [Dichomitus squalens]
MRPTYYLPLGFSLPLPAGTPIVLLPQGVPAYYLSTYSGPTAALTTQFEEALRGLGAGDWMRATSPQQDGPSYIIAWLAVQNKQGEDKGMPIIWPATLCVAYHSSSPSAHARSTLPYIPELPSQLQASPPPPAAAVPASLSFAMAAPSPAADGSVSATTSQAPLPLTDREKLISSVSRRPSLLRSSPTSDSLRAFRTLSLAKKPYARDIKKVAGEVGRYVDSVLKERERERERIKRERQEQEIAIARAKLASANPPPKEETPVPPATNTPTTPAMPEEVAAPVAEPASLPMDVESTDPESYPTVESDHSGDSLFSPPDAPIDLPSTDEEPQPAAEQLAPVDSDMPKEEDAPAPLLKTETDAEQPSMGFDPFNGFDSSWNQSNGYMDPVYPDMDFNMSLGSLGGGRATGVDADNYDMDDGFGVFTEDDFDFFDAPSTQRPVPSALVPPSAATSAAGAAVTNGMPSLGLAPLITLEGPLSGPGPPSASMAQSSPWVPHLGEPYSPQTTAEVHGLSDGLGPPPELLPPSPTKTPSSHSAPTTPSVHLSDTYRPNMLGPRIFDPIPFASSHREADGKYAIGKFALPSPPAEDRVEPLPAATTLLPGWKMNYSAATDPRIGVVRKLIGVKRKSLSQGTRANRRMSLWESDREPEDWQSGSPSPAGPDSEESEDELWVEDEEMTSAPRPSTPPPSYLPLGHGLLKTHFHHSHLLPMCTPLRPPGMAVNAVPGNAPPISVPTPVSPAAILGAASEKSKSLEAAAQILVKEVVENPVWQEAWRANASLSLTPPVPPAQIWQADAKYISQLVGNQSPGSAIDLQVLFGSAANHSEVTLMPLESPLLVVGKGESIIQVSPTSLRFWEKLGLSPRAGPKDVVAFVLFEEKKDEDREAEIETWLAKVSAAYSAKNFGSHAAGSSNVFIKPGLAPVRFNTLRKTICSFVQEITTPYSHLVLYIATPSHIISSSSTTLRQILSAVRRFYKQHPQGDILVQLVPESLIFGTHIHPGSSLGGLDAFVCSVYDRLLQPVKRAMSRELFIRGPPVTSYLEAPAFALVPYAAGKARNTAVVPRISFALESTASSLDVTHRHMLLHVGYQVSACGRWIIAACIDGEGEAHDLKVWLTPDENVEQFVVGQIWSFVTDFARRANIEWRIVVSKLGLISQTEANAWTSHLDSSMSSTSSAGPPLHATLLSVDIDNPWTFIAPADVNTLDVLKRNPSGGSQILVPKSSSRHMHTIFSDATCATYSLSPSTGYMYPAYLADRRTNSPSHLIPGSSDCSFIPDVEDEDSPSSNPGSSTDPLRVLSWTMVICAPSSADHTSVSTMRIFLLHAAHSSRSTYGVGIAGDTARSRSRQLPPEHMSDIVRNFHELAVLSRAKWKLRADPVLPFHLAALEVMRAALAGGAVDS